MIDIKEPIPERYKRITLLRDRGATWRFTNELTGIPISTARRWVKRTRFIRKERSKVMLGLYVAGFQKELGSEGRITIE